MWARPEVAGELPVAVAGARHLVESTPGCVSFEFLRCVEDPSAFLLLITWESLSDHLDGFRASDRFGLWRAALEPMWARAPEVFHFERT